VRKISLGSALGIVVTATAGVLLGAVAPASAAPAEPTGITFWSGAFTGQQVSYPAASESCTALPFAAHAQLNLTETAVNVYSSADCTGFALYFPANDIHSFGRDGLSYRVAG
jgi:hypothetical protein